MSTARVRRFDVGELAPPERLPNGWLRASGRIARVGLQEYEDAGGGSHVELRIPEEVFDPASLRSFALVPVTNTHPPVLLDARTAKTYAVGSVGEVVERDGETDFVRATLMLTDEQAITYAEAGRAELSNGYTCRLDATQIPELVAKWGRYDFVQREIRGNHVALVDVARAGPEARLRLDGSDAAVLGSRSTRTTRTETTPMPQVLKIDGLTLEINDANAPALQQALDKALGEARSKGDGALAIATQRADKAEKLAAVLRANGRRAVDLLAEVRRRWDAMKARMMSCDECGGSGKVQGDGAEPVKCDYCDGKGSFRMHDAVAAAMAGGEPGADVDAAMEDPDGDMDADELEVEQATETEAGKADAARKRVDAAKKREEFRAGAAKRRVDSLDRRIARAAVARAALLGEAARVLGAKWDGSKLDAVAIRKAVILKLAPEAKLDGKTAVQIEERYATLIEGLPEAPSASDNARLGASPFGTKVPQRGDGGPAPTGPAPKGRAAMLAQYDDANKKARIQK